MILCFHELGKPTNPYCLPINDFKKVIEANSEDEIHFDDGRKGLLALGDEYLKSISRRSTIFVVPNFVKKMVPDHERYSEFLNYADIEKLIKLGFEIGSHSLTHCNLTETTGYRWKEEIIFSKKWLEDRFQIKVEKFSWPYGRVNHWLQIEAEKIYKYCYTLDSIMGIKRKLVLSDLNG